MLTPTVSSPMSPTCWKLRPIPRAARSLARNEVTSRPARATRPASIRCSPEMALNSVVLPAPLGPMRPTIDPSGTRTETRSRAWRPPKATEMPSTTSRSSIALADDPWAPAAAIAGGGRFLGRRHGDEVVGLGLRSWFAGRLDRVARGRQLGPRHGHLGAPQQPLELAGHEHVVARQAVADPEPHAQEH